MTEHIKWPNVDKLNAYSGKPKLLENKVLDTNDLHATLESLQSSPKSSISQSSVIERPINSKQDILSFSRCLGQTLKLLTSVGVVNEAEKATTDRSCQG